MCTVSHRNLLTGSPTANMTASALLGPKLAVQCKKGDSKASCIDWNLFPVDSVKYVFLPQSQASREFIQKTDVHLDLSYRASHHPLFRRGCKYSRPRSWRCTLVSVTPSRRNRPRRSCARSGAAYRPSSWVHFGAYELVKEFAGGNVEGANNEWIATCTYSPSFFIPISGTAVS